MLVDMHNIKVSKTKIRFSSYTNKEVKKIIDKSCMNVLIEIYGICNIPAFASLFKQQHFFNQDIVFGLQFIDVNTGSHGCT